MTKKEQLERFPLELGEMIKDERCTRKKDDPHQHAFYFSDDPMSIQKEKGFIHT